MKKYNIFFLMCIIISLLVGCLPMSPPPMSYEDVPKFSYEEDLAIYAENSSNVKSEGFVNTSELEETIYWHTDAIEQAEKECPIECKLHHTYFDSASNVWKIEFWDTRDAEGYPQYVYATVYLNNKGVTLLVVYGE